jgi:glycosyltransferase A (GT-A) superfamily protein (DUF2064 family)
MANDPDSSTDLVALEPVFGKQKTYYLGRAMFFDTLSLCLSIPRTDTIVCYYPEGSEDRYRQMIELYAREEFDKKLIDKVKNIRLVPQQGNMMISRIDDAFREAFESGYKRVAMIGAYCIPLDYHLINAGFLLLKENDIVIGPSFSGRYYMFGMSRPNSDIFQGVQWESNDFYIRLNQNMKKNGTRFQELELSYEVYTPEELNQLIIDIERWRSLGDERTAYHTERCLRAIQQ